MLKVQVTLVLESRARLGREWFQPGCDIQIDQVTCFRIIIMNDTRPESGDVSCVCSCGRKFRQLRSLTQHCRDLGHEDASGEVLLVSSWYFSNLATLIPYNWHWVQGEPSKLSGGLLCPGLIKTSAGNIPFSTAISSLFSLAMISIFLHILIVPALVFQMNPWPCKSDQYPGCERIFTKAKKWGCSVGSVSPRTWVIVRCAGQCRRCLLTTFALHAHTAP